MTQTLYKDTTTQTLCKKEVINFLKNIIVDLRQGATINLCHVTFGVEEEPTDGAWKKWRHTGNRTLALKLEWKIKEPPKKTRA